MLRIRRPDLEHGQVELVKIVVRFLFNRAKIDRLLEGEPTLLIRDGQIVNTNLDRELITEDELRAALRRQGVADPSEVEQAMLETSGAISVIQKRPTCAERYREDIIARLDELTGEVRALRQGGGTVA